GRLPLPVGFLPDRHLRAPPGERPAAGSAPLLAARVQTTAAPGGGDHPAHPRGDRRAPAVLAVADGDAGGGGLDHLRAERAAGADPGRLPRPGRRGGLAATALLVAERAGPGLRAVAVDRKSTRLNSSHVSISYAVFCLK